LPPGNFDASFTRRRFSLAALSSMFPSKVRAQHLEFARLALEGDAEDRSETLLRGARGEGSVIVYGSAPIEDMSSIFTQFEDRFAVRVRYWRAGPQELIRRIRTEIQAGRFDVDMIQTNGPTLETLRRDNLLQAIVSPVQKDLLPQAVPEHREWVGERLNIIIGAYNTKAIAPEAVPTSFQDFLDPRWKGKLTVEISDYDWFATVAAAMGEAEAIALFRQIASTNGLSVRKGHTLLTTLVASGEVPVSLNVFTYKVEQLAKMGAPIAPLAISPAVGRVNGIAALRRPAHPHAALLYYDFMLSDAQHILASRDFTPTNQRIKPLSTKLDLRFVEPATMLDEGHKWTRLWREITSLRPPG
jgi:iron(III) transport system substrate-binding protein